MNKRGQIVVFIIIGAIILFAIGAVFLIRSYVVEREVALEVAEAEELPSEMEPIRTFTQNCIETVGSRALVRLGQQGGYIYPAEWDGLSFDITDPTDSDGISFPNSELRVPYWWHNTAENEQNQIFLSSNQPSIDKMEDDLARYVRLELGSCLNNYESFRPLGFEVVEGQTLAEVGIVPGEVRFLVQHPLEITLGEGGAKVRNFYVTVPLDLMQMYNVAGAITEAQRNFTFLENHMLNLIEMFSDVDAGKLPPMEAHSFDVVNTIFWPKSKVRQDLKNILVSYTSMFRYLNSRNYYKFEYPAGEYSAVKQRAYDNTILPLEGADNLDVRFQYLDFWQPYFDVNSEGELIRPEHISLDFFGLGYFGIQHYTTLYDLSYPAFVSLNMPQGLEGEDYQFNFALEGNIRTNTAAETDQNLTEESVFEESQFCDLNQRNSGEISIEVVDAYTKERLPNSEIFYSAGGERCSIGVTDENGVFTDKFPVAVGGLLTAANADYLSKSVPFDTAVDETDTLRIGLWKIKEIEISIRKKNLYNCKRTSGDDVYCFYNSESEAFNTSNPFEALMLEQFTAQEPSFAAIFRVKDSDKAKRTMWYFDDAPTNLGSNETGVFSLGRVSDFDSNLNVAGMVSGTESFTARLAPGNYTLGTQVIFDKEYFIPEEERCVLDAAGICAQEIDVPQTLLEQLAGGGVSWEDEQLYFEIKPADFYSANRMILHTITPAFYDIPENGRIVEDLEIMNQVQDLSIDFREELEPVFI